MPARQPGRRDTALAEPLVAAAHGLDRDTGRSLTSICAAAGGRRGTVVQAAQPLQRGEPPDLVAAVRHLEGVDVERGEQLALGPCRVERAAVPLRPLGQFAATQPTAPSICSSISRLSSSAYSIGSSLAIGSTKPRTTMAIASSSVRPRLIR